MAVFVDVSNTTRTFVEVLVTLGIVVEYGRTVTIAPAVTVFVTVIVVGGLALEEHLQACNAVSNAISWRSLGNPEYVSPREGCCFRLYTGEAVGTDLRHGVG